MALPRLTGCHTGPHLLLRKESRKGGVIGFVATRVKTDFDGLREALPALTRDMG
jgi:hypothetical protein